ncbi:Mu transposase C-terminal domain-containing protein [Guptibacillus hwajinpoensis]|uniref:Mu transposase C-terminal domain-containing protein n=1 Tax=Guptibacillus hwajinpoensis TaxID=208199 RepID=UPI00069E4C56|nr:Mu transposase C-terminal domain-containing protein [Alkalihalobacillus macyae]
MLFTENEIIQYTSAEGDEILERILWSDGVILFTINLNDDAPLPEKRLVSFLTELLKDKQLNFITEEPLTAFFQERAKESHTLLREERWSAISNIVEKEPEIYVRELRGALIKEQQSRTKKSKRLIYKYLRQYWQGGKTKDSLLPLYKNSGGKGKMRQLGRNKVGRPKKFSHSVGNGMNVTEEDKRIIQVSITKWYHTSKKNPLSFTYKQMKKEFYGDGYRFENGVKKPILKDANEVPSIGQFRYWFSQFNNIEATSKKRNGSRNFNLKERALLGNSRSEAVGPGSKFQIDATIADVYLKSSYNKEWIIGRPVIYVVIDVFSRLIVGLYVGLEGPSWIGMIMALCNTAADKVEFCKRYGIDIEPQDWSSKYFPSAILGDRGELVGKRADVLADAFNIRIENTPPYRADWKGIVERYFRTFHGEVKPFLPGYIDKDFQKRGARDYRLDAKFDLEEFTQLMIKCVLHHNNEHYLRTYHKDEEMIAQNVELRPRDIWEWGIQNRTGKLKYYSEELVKLTLLPRAEATVTSQGIKFNKMHYSCETALKEKWFERARMNKSWKVKISHDPRNTSFIYMRDEDTGDYERCYLLEHQERYKNRTYQDVVFLHNYEEMTYQANQNRIDQADSDHISDVEALVSKAEKSNNEAEISNVSNHVKVKGIQENRRAEKERNRNFESFDIKRQEYDEKEIKFIQSSDQNTDEESLSFPNSVDKLRKVQKERLQNVRRG